MLVAVILIGGLGTDGGVTVIVNVSLDIATGSPGILTLYLHVKT
jgi:hypothetical protein